MEHEISLLLQHEISLFLSSCNITRLASYNITLFCKIIVSHSDFASFFITIHLNSKLSFIPSYNQISKPVGKLSTSTRNVQYNGPFNDNSSLQTVVVAVYEWKWRAIRSTNRRLLRHKNRCDSHQRAEAASDPTHFSMIIEARKPK